MKQVSLTVKIREKKGKTANKKLRRQEWIPAVVYGRSQKPLSLEVPLKDFSKALRGAAGSNVIITLSVADQASKAANRTALIKEIQQHPLSGNVLHVDFHEISLTEEIKVDVPVVPKGEAVGVKMDGGVLDHSLWELQIFCLPTQIPDRIEVDVTDLKIGSSIHVRDLKAPSGVKILTDPDTSVFSVKHPTQEIVPEAAAETATAEPEVIREKKAEETTAEAPASAKGGASGGKEGAKPAAPAGPAPSKEKKEGKTG
jgi:large subunit ribosomal protein L25